MASNKNPQLTDLLVLSLMRQGLRTVKDLNTRLKQNEQTVRRTLSRLQEEKAIVKGPYIEGVKTFKLTKDVERQRPLLRRWDVNQNIWVFAGLETLLPAAFQPTKASIAANFLPQVASKLLMIGFKYNTLKEQHLDAEVLAQQTKPILKELRAVRAEFESHLQSLEQAIHLFKQIDANPEFWDIEHLSYHFNNQLNMDSELIPPVGNHEVIDTYNRYRQQETT